MPGAASRTVAARVRRPAGTPAGPPDPARPRPSGIGAAYARLVDRLRWVIVAGWVLLAAASVFVLPSAPPEGGGLEGLLPDDLPAVDTEIRSVQTFGFPLLGRTAVVQRDPAGLSVLTQSESVARAAAITRGDYGDTAPVLGAIPVPNALGLFPGSAERDTTVVTYLFVPPDVGFGEQLDAARRLVDRHFQPNDGVVGVTGSVPARAELAWLLGATLPAVELATLVAVVLIVAVNFRSVVAPVLTLAVAGVAVLVTVHAAPVLGELAGVAVPSELEPLLVALLLGVTTDYVIFYLSGLQRTLATGPSGRDAAARVTAEVTPIVAVAGLTVAAGTASLLVAQSGLFRAFGPGMALAVLIGAVASVTLVPALLAIFGRWLLWPNRPSVIAEMPGPGPAGLLGRVRRPGRLVAVMIRPGVAVALLVGCVVSLGLAAAPVRQLDLGVAFVPSLPADNEVRQAAAAAQQGFAPGILSPTVLLLEAPGITEDRLALQRFGDLLARQPGVQGVLGAGQQPLPTELGVVLARSGDAARFLIVLDSQPLGASAIDALERMRDRTPALLDEAGLGGTRFGYAGDTAIAQAIVGSTQDDLARIAIAALLVNFLLLVLFLRAVVAPLYLLACNLLALGASLGLAVLVFQRIGGADGLTFYVPFAAAVLLVALGSDYNIFGVGHVWEEARRRPIREAIVVAVPQSTRAITAAGITLATSFGLLALVPLRPFRELAFVMAVGIMLDAVVVRSVLVPVLLSLVGRASAWPGRFLRTEGTAGGELPGGPSPAVVHAAGESPPSLASGGTDRRPPLGKAVLVLLGALAAVAARRRVVRRSALRSSRRRRG